MQDPSGTIGSRFTALRPYLSEYQRRLWLGAEAAALGPRGVSVVSAATGVASTTIRRGRNEIGGGSPGGVGRSRRAGAGRKTAEVHDLTLVDAFDALIDPAPTAVVTSPLRWTTSPVRSLAAALRENGHPVSDFVVRRLLRQAGYSSQQVSRVPVGVRDRQFAYVNDVALTALEAGDPVIAVTSLREVRTAVIAAAPTRPTPETDRATAEFALDVIGLWWRRIGMVRYPASARLVVCPQRDGSAEVRSAWARGLASLAAATGLVVTSCQLPAGSWRWQSLGPPIDFRLELAAEAGVSERHGVVVREVWPPGSVGPPAVPVRPERSRAAFGTGGPDPSWSVSVSHHAVNAEWNLTAAPQTTLTRR